METTAQAPTQSLKRRRTTEHETTPSDRTKLVQEANTFAFYMVQKQVLPAMNASVTGNEVPMTPEESSTYNAALGFLKRQFDLGFHASETHAKKTETEESIDYAKPETPVTK